MFSFRCTRTLLKKLDEDVVETPPSPTTRLGDWYGNTFFPGQARYVIFVSELSLLSVVMPLRERKKLLLNFQSRLRELLTALSMTEDQIEAELRETETYAVAPTISRSILGSMNDLVLNADDYVQSHREPTLLELELMLAEIPCGPLDMAYPAEVAIGLLL